MNTQKQITLMVALVLLMLGGCAAYTVYDQPRENASLKAQQATSAERGARIFARYCRQCHGNAGEGRVGPQLNRADLRDPNTMEQTQAWVSDTIHCGRIGKVMPPWSISEGGSLTDEQIRDLVTLITGVQPGVAPGLETPQNFWDKAAEFSRAENLAAAQAADPHATAPATLQPISDVLAGASITGATVRVCGQIAPPTPAASSGPPAGLQPQNAWTEDATDNKFSVTDMEITTGTSVTVTFNNKGQAIHNWEVLDSSGKVLNGADGKPISVPLTDGGKSNTVTFTINTPGTYKFQCQVHPTEMIGQLYVVAPGGAAGGSATPAAGGTPAAAGTPAASPTP